MSDNPMFLYAGEYENVDDAKADLEVLKGVAPRACRWYLRRRRGHQDRRRQGKDRRQDREADPAWWVGWHGCWGSYGSDLPSLILVGGLLGAGAGALIGHLEGGMSRSDIKEVGEMLEDSEAALIVVGRRRSSGRWMMRPAGPRSS